MEETKQQITARKAVIEALNLNDAEVDTYEFDVLVKGGLSYKFTMTNGKYYYANISKQGVLSGYGSSRITEEHLQYKDCPNCSKPYNTKKDLCPECIERKQMGDKDWFRK